MKHTLFIPFLLLFAGLVNAQQTEVATRLNNQEAIPAAIAVAPASFNAASGITLPSVAGYEDATLVLKQQYSSMLGEHFLYQQVYEGIPVYGAYLKVNKDKHGNLLSAFHTLIHVDEFETTAATPAADYWAVDGHKLIAAVSAKEGHHFILKQPGGALLYSYDKRLYYRDTMAKAMVFNPDPVTSAGVIYGQGGTYKSFNDSDYALLNDQRVLKEFPARFDEGTFHLANKYSIITEFENPAHVPSISENGEFFFTRSQIGFKEVMAMYHIYAVQLFIQSLGFNEANYQLKVDPHASNGDNSYFSYQENGDTTLRFGLGGVPDAEDADVIVHEYTHAISFSLNPDGDVINAAMERRAIEEGLCDAMACAYSKRLIPLNWRNVFNWDGHNEFWGGRNGNSSKTYEDKINSMYSDCEIWSSAMNSLSEAIGEDALIKLMLSVIPQFTPNTTMPQAARMMYDADSIMNNKVHLVELANEFNARKFGNFPVGLNDIAFDRDFSLLNTLAFAQGTGDANLSTKQGGVFAIEVIDVNGRKINSMEGSSVVLKTDDYRPGIYFVSITFNGRSGYHKLVKY